MNLLQAKSAPPTVDALTESAELVRPSPMPRPAFRLHWPEYLMETAGLGLFMLAACLFGALYENPTSPIRQAITSSALRRVLMGLSMGITAVAIIYSPWGKKSGAHINPSITITFWRLRKISTTDALFYIAAQFLGAVLGVIVAALLAHNAISHPAVRYVVTVPGHSGVAIALAAEFLISFGMMSLVLHLSNNDRLSPFTGLFAGALVATYIALEAPFSGMSMNPARTLGSAFSANVFDALWIYFTAPPLAMLCAAELYLWRKGTLAVRCCKLHHDNTKQCIFCGMNGGFAS
jgi:aquaporin Z